MTITKKEYKILFTTKFDSVFINYEKVEVKEGSIIFSNYERHSDGSINIHSTIIGRIYPANITIVETQKEKIEEEAKI